MGVRVEGGELWGDYFTSFCSYLSVFAGHVKLRLGGVPCFFFCLFRAIAIVQRRTIVLLAQGTPTTFKTHYLGVPSFTRALSSRTFAVQKNKYIIT